MTQIDSRRAGPLQAIVLLLQCTLGAMGVTILAPVIPKIIANYQGVPGVEFWGPLIVTIPSVCVAVVCPFAGYFADLIGRRNLLIWAIGLYALIGVAPYFLNTIPQMIIARAGLGVVEAIVMTVSTTLIGDYFKGEERDKWLGYQTAVASVSAVGLIALGGLMGNISWRAPFLVYLSAAPLMLLIILFTWEPRPDELESNVNAGSWSAFPWSKMLGIYLLTLPASMMFYIVQIQMSTALGELGINRSSTIGLLTAGASIGVPVGTLVFQKVSKLSTSRLLLMEFFLIALGFIGMSAANDLNTFLVFTSINQIGCGMLLPTMVTWAMRQLSFSMRGRGIGIWISILSLGTSLGPAAVTALAIYSDGRVMPAFKYVGFVAIVFAGGALIASLRPRNDQATSSALH
ncbi:MAG: MFS transporter [Steroidobacteraceae bacterium]